MFEQDGRHVPDSMVLEKLDKAFERIFSQSKKYELYRFIGGIIFLDRLTFEENANEESVVSSRQLLELAAQLMSIDSEELNTVLTKRTMNIPTEKGETIRYVVYTLIYVNQS